MTKERGWNLNKREIAAMWIYGSEYAASGAGAIDFYAHVLTDAKRRIIEKFLAELSEAPEN